MKPASPDPSGPSASATPEAWSLRAEWRAEPPSLAREEAGRALDALGRAGAEILGPSPTDEVPPVPEDLRARWAEAYGRPEADAAPPRPALPENDHSREHGFFEWLTAWLRPGRLVLAGAAGVAVVGFVAMMRTHGDGRSGAGPAGPASAITRGPGNVVSGEAAPVAVVAPATVVDAGAGVMAALKHAFPGRPIHLLTGADTAAAMAQKEARLVVVNLGSGLVTAWRNGTLAEEFPPTASASPAGVVSQVESADDMLEQVAPAAP